MNDILRVFHFNSKWRVSAVIFTDCFVFFQIEKKVAIEKSSARIAISFFVVVTIELLLGSVEFDKEFPNFINEVKLGIL